MANSVDTDQTLNDLDLHCYLRVDTVDLLIQSSGPSYSKLTTSLVNDSLNFTSSDTQIC